MTALACRASAPAPDVLAPAGDREPAMLVVEAVAGSSAIPAALPHRGRATAGVDVAALRRASSPHPLLARAERVAAAHRPTGAVGSVHGDLWQGNTVWRGDDLTAVIDGDCAGSGYAGVDLGSLRCDAPVCFGVQAAADVPDGWQEAAGRAADDVAHWDVVAALCTPPGMGWLVGAIGAQGRPDLTRQVLLERRDAFLEAAPTAVERGVGHR